MSNQKRDNIKMSWHLQGVLVIMFVIIMVTFRNYLEAHKIDRTSFDNIKEKCGVLETDLITTTSLKKISDCLDLYQAASGTVTIKSHGSLWHVPRDGRTYNFDLLDTNECESWCRE